MYGKIPIVCYIIVFNMYCICILTHVYSYFLVFNNDNVQTLVRPKHHICTGTTLLRSHCIMTTWNISISLKLSTTIYNGNFFDQLQL